jgi:hypothetical protein
MTKRRTLRSGRALAGVLALLGAWAVSTVVTAPPAAATAPALAVNAAADLHVISPYIYGANFVDPALATQSGITIDRWGGDNTDVYNWQLGVANAAAYFFENGADCFPNCTAATNTDFGYADFLTKDQGLQIPSLFTVPLVGWVPRAAPVTHPFTCSYPSAVYPVQTAFDPYDACGSGDNQGVALADKDANGTWSVPAKPAAPADTSTLTGISCSAATACTAVGFAATLSAAGTYAAATHVPVVQRWNGSAWASQPLPAMPAGSSTLLSAVACASATACTAVGETAGLGDYTPLAESWDGTGWSEQPLPAPAGAVVSWLTAVACPAAGDCMAAGTYVDGDGMWRPFAEQDRPGSGWSLLSMPSVDGAEASTLSGLSCASSTSCIAVGSYTLPRSSATQVVRFPLAEQWDGTAWTVPAGQPATPESAAESELSSVSCPAPSTCTAVGFEFDNNSSGHPAPLAETWNGAGWLLRTTPHATGSAQTLPFAVSCVAANACVMVGSVAAADGAPQKPFTEHWNGTSWASQTAPLPSGASSGELAGIACTAASTCLAVGFDAGGATATELTTSPSATSVPIDAGYDAGLVDHLLQTGQPARIYELGNEPDLWGLSHHDVHPQPESAQELVAKSIAAADAVKAAQPDALIDGYAASGWFGIFCTGADTASNSCDDTGCTSDSPDCADHDGVPMIEYYLNTFRQHDAGGVRHLDYVDVHYYPQTYCYAGGGGGFGCPKTAPPPTDVTRSLWDPTYPDPGWIGYPDGVHGTVAFRLIPRMHSYVDGPLPGNPECPADGCYPGTQLALTEYNLSDSTNPRIDALIQADTLGIFAREGVAVATRWPLDSPGTNAYDGCGVSGACAKDGSCLVPNGCLIGDMFRLYRNYDHAGGQFGDEWIRSTSTLSGGSALSGQGSLAIYAARRSSDGAITIVVINKTASGLTAPLTLSGFTAPTTAQTWRWTGGACSTASQARICSLATTAIRGNKITYSYPARSVTLFVIHPG